MLAPAMSFSNASFFQCLTLTGEAETAALGRRVARLLRPGDTVTLTGPLGAGKTVFARGLIRSFLAGEDVPSPTFTLVQTYETARFPIWHVDLYRLKAASEVRELGLDEALERGVLLIEWPDRMGPALPNDRLDVVIEGMDEENDDEERIVKLIARGDWASRVGDLSDFRSSR
jgi:tRNA threonylcarbamoyladenosine biosynthesis protein TsaE